MGEIYWSLNAQENLEAIADHIAKDSPYYAVNFVNRIMRYVETLGDLPEALAEWFPNSMTKVSEN